MILTKTKFCSWRVLLHGPPILSWRNAHCLHNKPEQTVWRAQLELQEGGWMSGEYWHLCKSENLQGFVSEIPIVMKICLYLLTVFTSFLWMAASISALRRTNFQVIKQIISSIKNLYIKEAISVLPFWIELYINDLNLSHNLLDNKVRSQFKNVSNFCGDPMLSYHLLNWIVSYNLELYCTILNWIVSYNFE